MILEWTFFLFFFDLLNVLVHFPSRTILKKITICIICIHFFLHKNYSNWATAKEVTKINKLWIFFDGNKYFDICVLCFIEFLKIYNFYYRFCRLARLRLSTRDSKKNRFEIMTKSEDSSYAVLTSIARDLQLRSFPYSTLDTASQVKRKGYLVAVKCCYLCLLRSFAFDFSRCARYFRENLVSFPLSLSLSICMSCHRDQQEGFRIESYMKHVFKIASRKYALKSARGWSLLQHATKVLLFCIFLRGIVQKHEHIKRESLSALNINSS